MTPDTSRRRAARALSLEHKLPLLISALLILTLISVAWAAYAQVKRSALEAAAERLVVVARQLADLSQVTAAQRAAAMRSVADDPAIRAALAAPPDQPPSPGVIAAVRRLVTPADSSPLVELWDARGQRRSLGARPAIRVEPALPPELLRAADHTDTAHVGRFYARGDSVFFWNVVAVREGGELRGYLAQRRQISTPARTEQQIRQLSGEAVTVFVRDSVGDLWATLGGVPTAVPPVTRRMARGLFEFMGPDREPHLAASARVAGTPWTLVLATPRRALLARPRTFLRRMALAMVVIVLLGAIAAWTLSRHVTRPIGTLAAAAEAIAAGDYGRRVAITRNDEVGRLGETFNTMAARVAESRRALEQRTEALRESNEELARQTAAAESANEAKSDFLAVMSHEIRTPINAILGYTQLLELGIPEPVTEGQRAQLERVRASGHHLLGLVNELLDLARVESGELTVQRERAVAADAADAALALLRPQAAAKGVGVVERCGGARDATYVGDEQRVRQVVVNLLSNAVKFTPPGGRVTVHCAVVERAPDELRLAGAGPWTTVVVEDTGIGIPEELTARVFEPFVQAETGLTRSAGGTGLGLAISRRLARLMGGDLTLLSRPGDGSRFTLWLPAAPNEAAASPAASFAPPAASATPRSNGAAGPAGAPAEGSLGEVGRALHRLTNEVVRRYVARLREEPAIPGADALTDDQLEDHLATLLADVAQSLVVLRTSAGSDSAEMMRDGTSIQQVIAERHGAQRFRLGWSEEAVVREHEVLREVVSAALGAEASDAARAVVGRFLEQAERVSVRGYREAARTEVGA